MKKSGYKSVLHIYLIFIVVIAVMLIIAIGTLFYMTTIQISDKQIVLSNYPKNLAEQFSKYISFDSSPPSIQHEGILLLEENHAWFQIIDINGNEIQNYNKPTNIPMHYSSVELLSLYQSEYDDSTVYINNITYDNQTWTYIIGFPINISKVVMYVNGEHFSSGKAVIILIIVFMLMAVFVLGILYSLWMTRKMSVAVSYTHLRRRRCTP